MSLFLYFRQRTEVCKTMSTSRTLSLAGPLTIIDKRSNWQRICRFYFMYFLHSSGFLATFCKAALVNTFGNYHNVSFIYGASAFFFLCWAVTRTNLHNLLPATQNYSKQATLSLQAALFFFFFLDSSALSIAWSWFLLRCTIFCRLSCQKLASWAQILFSPS